MARTRLRLATTPETVHNFPAAERALAAGASTDDLVTAMRAASYETAFRVLFMTGSEHVPDDGAGPDLRRSWALVDFDLADDPAGPASALIGVHEELLEADPSGRGGQDLWN